MLVLKKKNKHLSTSWVILGNKNLCLSSQEEMISSSTPAFHRLPSCLWVALALDGFSRRPCHPRRPCSSTAGSSEERKNEALSTLALTRAKEIEPPTQKSQLLCVNGRAGRAITVRRFGKGRAGSNCHDTCSQCRRLT